MWLPPSIILTTTHNSLIYVQDNILFWHTENRGSVRFCVVLFVLLGFILIRQVFILWNYEYLS